MSKDETCSGFHPDEIDKRMKEAVELGEARALPRPVVPESVREVIEELDDVIRWVAELASPTRLAKVPACTGMAQGELLSAVARLGAARAQLIAAALS